MLHFFCSRRNWLYVLFFIAFQSFFNGSIGVAKPYKRVLVISGGGINPGFAAGIIAGAQMKGWQPDLIIATCGAGIGATIHHSEQSLKETYDVLMSQNFFKALKSVKIETANLLTLASKLSKAEDHSIYPSIFHNNVLYVPFTFPPLLKNNTFHPTPASAKLILISAKSLFGPEDVGQKREQKPLFQQVFFTDDKTAEFIRGWTLPEQQSYPNTNIARNTETITSQSTMMAMRAGLADPYLLNPLKVNDDYYFAGAIDLYPIDLALALGEEVMATYPMGFSPDYEEISTLTSYGFSQNKRRLETLQHTKVKWIDISDADSVGFNPAPKFIWMTNMIPRTYHLFTSAVAKQWQLGRDRSIEALTVAPGSIVDVRSHLRRPISPRLLDDFSCHNAYEWKTNEVASCISDKVDGCNRRTAKTCTPLR